MQEWSFLRYKRPYLAADSVLLEKDKRIIRLSAGAEHLTLQCSSRSTAKEVHSALVRLRNPDVSLWRNLRRDGFIAKKWHTIVRRLDERSFIADADPASIKSKLGDEFRRFEDTLHSTKKALTSHITEGNRTLAIKHVRKIVGE